MNLSRRVILIAVLVVASAVSLGLAGTAKANIVGQLKKECNAVGGKWTEGVGADGKGFGRCETQTCTKKVVLVGAIVITFPICKTSTVEVKWSL